MSRLKNTPKTGGRKKGTPNKITSIMRGLIASLLNDNKQLLSEDFLSLKPKERLQVLIKLLPYVIPNRYDSPLCFCTTGVNGCTQIDTIKKE